MICWYECTWNHIIVHLRMAPPWQQQCPFHFGMRPPQAHNCCCMSSCLSRKLVYTEQDISKDTLKWWGQLKAKSDLSGNLSHNYWIIHAWFLLARPFMGKNNVVPTFTSGHSQFTFVAICLAIWATNWLIYFNAYRWTLWNDEVSWRLKMTFQEFYHMIIESSSLVPLGMPLHGQYSITMLFPLLKMATPSSHLCIFIAIWATNWLI